MSVSVRRNIGFMFSQGAAAVNNSSVVVKAICATVLFSYFLSFSESAVDALTVTPGTLLPPRFHIWTAFTTIFLELHWWLLLIDLIVVGLCAKLIEPLWGALEMLIFFGLMNLSVVLSTTLIYFIGYCITSDEKMLFETHIHGLFGYVAAVCVAVKQIMPDHILFRIPVAGTIKFRNRNLPLLLLFALVISCSLQFMDWVYFWMFLCGTYGGFLYLRYAQKHSNGTRGDRSEAFDFATFFPNVLQGPVSGVVNAGFNILVRLGVAKNQPRKYNFGEPLPTGIIVNLGGSSTLDTERRKQIALKALQDRMQSPDLGSPSATAWPDLLDAEDELSTSHSSENIPVSSSTLLKEESL